MEYQNRNKEDFEKCLKVLIGNPQVKQRFLKIFKDFFKSKLLLLNFILLERLRKVFNVYLMFFKLNFWI